ncbi:hypothetical protein HK101_011394 [Irineochytrium annulatum]|nr:hypothetical protein HK101_011394 [Irineochytrium annulatum]
MTRMSLSFRYVCTLTSEVLTAISSATALTKLELKLPDKIRQLDLLPALTKLHNMHELSLDFFQVEIITLDEISNLPNLRHVTIRGAEWKNVAVVFFSNLRTLSLTRAILVMSKRSLAWTGIPNLEELYVTDSVVITTKNKSFEKRLEEMILDRTVTPALTVVTWRNKTYTRCLRDWKWGHKSRALQ